MGKIPSHIAVIRLSAMGDVAMTVPVLRALTTQHPTLQVTVVSRELYRPFFCRNYQCFFFSIDLKQRHKGFFGLYRLYRDLRKRNVEAIADLHNVLRSQIVSRFFALSGIETVSIDKGRSEKKALTRSTAKVFRQLKITVERYADVFRKLGFSIDLSKPEFLRTPDLSSETQLVVGEKNGNWIGVAPFAQHQGKVYPMDLMAQVIAQLGSDPTHTIFLFGAGSSETKQLDHWAGAGANIRNMSGKLGLAKELELISRLDVMLSMDSGNAHMAAMFGVPVITLWGATHPFAGFAPFGQPLEHALTADREKYPLLPTSVYGNKVVSGYEDVMRSIPVARVVTAVNSVLNRNLKGF